MGGTEPSNRRASSRVSNHVLKLSRICHHLWIRFVLLVGFLVLLFAAVGSQLHRRWSSGFG